MLYVNCVISEFSSHRERLIVEMVACCAYVISNLLDIAAAATIGPLLIMSNPHGQTIYSHRTLIPTCRRHILRDRYFIFLS